MWEIRYARAADLPFIREIWSASFDDSPTDRDRFLNVVDVSTECVVAIADGRPVSMGFFLPAQLHTPWDKCPMRYLYAASTLPAYRGRGAFACLLRTALQQFAENGVAASFLNPASFSLIEYYRRFGYRPFAFIQTLNGTDRGGEDWRIEPMTADEYRALRSSLLPSMYVEWDARMIAYAASYAQPIRVGDDACALCAVNGTTVAIIELLGVESVKQKAVCASIARHYEQKRYTARVYAEQGECFGMVLPLSDKINLENTMPYMGLAFD